MTPRLRLVLVLLISALLTVTTVGGAEARPTHPSRIDLPTGFQPEGITIGKRSIAYLGSRADGDIYAANLKTGEGRVISQGPGTASLGLKVSGDKLYVAGGASGTGRVVSIRTGKILASYPFTPNTSFVNDVVLTKHTAWFTDSRQPQLYAVSRARIPARATVRTLALKGDWVQGEGTSANGITETPDGRALLVVQTNTGFLFRVNKSTGVAKRVDLGGTLLTNGDGLLLRGRTLYAVQNQLNQIAVLKLNRAGTQGGLRRILTSPDFDVPTTVAYDRGSLYLPNARFSTPTATEFWITRVKV